MSRIVLDTDVASLLFKDELPDSLFKRLMGQPLAVTYVTVGELTKWTVARKWGAPRRTALATWLARFPVLPANADVGRKWGEVVAYAELRGRPRSVNDSWIAAACLANNLALATFNIADFQDFADHEGLELITVNPRP